MQAPHASSRPDVDIEEDIGQIIRSYAPLKASRPYFAYRTENGKVIVSGHVRSPQARRVLVDNVPNIAGVISLDAAELYDDETLRVAVGALLPPGVYANVHYGAVALTGNLPHDASADALSQAVTGVAGVRRVGVEFGVPTGTDTAPQL